MFLSEKHIKPYAGRCSHCFMRTEVCICSSMPVIDNKCPLTVVMHAREAYKTTNTGRLAHYCLKNSRVILRGDKNKPLVSANYFPKGPSYLLLTLTSDAIELSESLIQNLKSPPHLVVPDGNWRQANKMGNRESALKEMLKVKLPVSVPSSYQLRREHHIEGLATIEAIARAYGIIESKSIQSQLEEIFDLMVSQTLKTRPPIPDQNLASL